MAKIEEGKYYVDGEGFYKCLEQIAESILRSRPKQEVRMVGRPIRIYIR